MSAVVNEREIDCRSAPDALWKIVTDTERLNRAIGFSKLSVVSLSNGTASRYLVSSRAGILPMEYEERPFEWVFPESYRVKRIMRSGPIATLELGCTLRLRADGGTRLGMRLVVEPRTRLLAPLLRAIGSRTLHSLESAILELDRAGEARAPRSAINERALARAGAALRERADADLARRLVAHVRDADDVEASRIRPFVLADEWKVDRRELLATCLEAVRAGLLELRWEVICPSCMTATQKLPALADLAEHGACQLCELEFALDLDQAVEATFAPVPAIRAVDAGPYCIGGPSRTPHVLAQTILPARGEATLPVPRELGKIRLFVRGGRASSVEVAEGAPSEVAVDSAEFGTTGGENSPAAPILVAPGGVLRIANPSRDEKHAKLERVTYTDQAARAALLMTMPAFRRDFSTDTLRAGTALKVARVGLFFSDLTGSTQLYSSAGDAAAFKLVLDHFDLVIGLIEKHGGSVVKTIGDAVMAVFPDDVAGLVASVAILTAFEGFRGAGGTRQKTHIKLGVFGGPCYAVTANERLDYFGQTVNIAARLQGEAKSGELIVPESLADAAIEAGKLPAAFVKERYHAELKGVDAPIAVARIRVG